MRRVTPDCARRVPRRCPWDEHGAENEPQRRKTRRRQIDDIVKPRRGPAEGTVPLVPIAYHTVGGFDRLKKPPPNEPPESEPKARRAPTVREVFRQALDGRARDARLVQHVRIATDDLR